MTPDSYKLLAQHLDALPNGYPPTPDGAELRLLAKLFTPEEAWLATQLRLTLETPTKLADRLGRDPIQLRKQLKEMARHGLITAGRTGGGLGYGLMPFAVGIYEMQIERMDSEMARLFEDYYRQAYGKMLALPPSVHRVIPVNETVQAGIEIKPFESVAEIINAARAWGVLDCICRKQKALIGQPCHHPLGMCMVLSETSGVFDQSATVRPLTRDNAMATLRQAAEAGLVHSVSNNQRGNWYICNCCTCSCAVLRGIAELGLANAVARSAFVNRVNEGLCGGCGLCLEACQFGALTLVDTAQVNETRCVGCGVCVITCPDGALGLVHRPLDEVLPPPETEADWRVMRAAARGLDLKDII